jgi:hypothetical protein
MSVAVPRIPVASPSPIPRPLACYCAHTLDDEEELFVPSSQPQEDGEDYDTIHSITCRACVLGIEAEGRSERVRLIRRAPPVVCCTILEISIYSTATSEYQCGPCGACERADSGPSHSILESRQTSYELQPG